MTHRKPDAATVVQQMLSKDRYSQWLGIEVLSIETGSVKLKMKVREEMCNGFGTCHGGVTYAFADSALAFAANSHGSVSLLINASMSYPAPVMPGNEIIATAEEQSLTDKIAIYQVKVAKISGELVGIFKGTVYRTHKEIALQENK